MAKKKGRRLADGGGPLGKARQKAQAGREQAAKIGLPPALLKREREPKPSTDWMPTELRRGSEHGHLESRTEPSGASVLLGKGATNCGLSGRASPEPSMQHPSD
jgi:hypothetical protein